MDRKTSILTKRERKKKMLGGSITSNYISYW